MENDTWSLNSFRTLHTGLDWFEKRKGNKQSSTLKFNRANAWNGHSAYLERRPMELKNSTNSFFGIIKKSLNT